MLRKHLFCFEEDTGGGSGGAGFEGHVDEAQDHVQQAAQAANQAAQTAPTDEQKAASRTVEEILQSLQVEIKRLNDYNERAAQEVEHASSVADEAGAAEEEEAEEAAPEVSVPAPPKRKRRRFNRKVEAR